MQRSVCLLLQNRERLERRKHILGIRRHKWSEPQRVIPQHFRKDAAQPAQYHRAKSLIVFHAENDFEIMWYESLHAEHDVALRKSASFALERDELLLELTVIQNLSA